MCFNELLYGYLKLPDKLKLMDTERIFDENGQISTRRNSLPQAERVNPVEYYKKNELRRRAIILRDLLQLKEPFLTAELPTTFFEKQAAKSLIGFFEKKRKTPIPKNFVQLLQTTRKKDQVKLLKGMSLNPDQLLSLIFLSYNDLGFLYSRYHFENLHKGLEGKKLPKLIELESNGNVRKVGATELSNGELKNVIEHRKVINSHFFEKEEIWHYFFLTYNSIAGKENHNNGKPHFHYISSGFGITKENFIVSMKTGTYRSTSIHVDLLEYGNQHKN